MRYAVLSVLLVLLIAVSGAGGAELTVAWNYNSVPLKEVTGFKLYFGTDENNIKTLVADIPKSTVTTKVIQPVLLEEHFDTNPGSKYNVTQGSWTWVPETKNMKFTGETFMVVFELPAGATSGMSFKYWPEKSTGSQAQVLSYVKDEAQTAYYELRVADAAGTRYSNWRKVYDQKWGGIDPAGAFGLPRYRQCTVVSGQSNLCPGFAVYMSWSPEDYSVELVAQPASTPAIVSGGAHGVDVDKRALAINKMEIIVNQQNGWIDDIVIGGLVEVQKKVNVNLPASGPLYLVATAYNSVGESGPSVPCRYETQTDAGPQPLQAPKNMRWRKLL